MQGDNLIEIIFAGYNTAVGVIANVFYYLDQNQKGLNQVRPKAELSGIEHM